MLHSAVIYSNTVDHRTPGADNECTGGPGGLGNGFGRPGGVFCLSTPGSMNRLFGGCPWYVGVILETIWGRVLGGSKRRMKEINEKQ